MQKYIARISIYSPQYETTIYEHYILDKKNLDKIKKLDIFDYNACCTKCKGNRWCISCIFDGASIKYENYMNIDNEDEMAIAKFVCQNQTYKLDLLLDLIANQNN